MRRTSGGVAPHLTLNLGVRYELPHAVRRQERRASTRFHPGVQSMRFPDAPAGLVYPGDPGVPRGIVHDRQEQLRAAARRGVGSRSATAADDVRAAWGMFYDALAGQGDFFQNGVLAPPFTPLVELNSPPAPITLAQSAERGHRRRDAFPAGADDHRLGRRTSRRRTRYHYNVDACSASWAATSASKSGYVGSRGRHLPIFMEVNPGAATRPGQTTPGARLFPAFALVRPTFSVARSRSTTRSRPARACGRRTASTSSRPTRYGHAQDHVVRPQHRRRAAAGPAGRPWRPGVVRSARSRSRGATRCSTCATASSSASARTADARRTWARSSGTSLGGWQLNGIVQAQTGFPLTRDRSAARHPLSDQPPRRHLRSERNAPHTTDQWFDTSCFVRAAARADGRPPGQCGPQHVRGPGSRRPTCRSSRTSTFGGPRRIQLRVEAFNVFNQARFNNPGGRDRDPELRADHCSRRRPRHPAGNEVSFLERARSHHETNPSRGGARLLAGTARAGAAPLRRREHDPDRDRRDQGRPLTRSPNVRPAAPLILVESGATAASR